MPYEMEVIINLFLRRLRNLRNILLPQETLPEPEEVGNPFVKQYYNRFCTILESLNFSIYAPEEEIEKKYLLAEQMIMEEDFESYKSDILVQFGL